MKRRLLFLQQWVGALAQGAVTRLGRVFRVFHVRKRRPNAAARRATDRIAAHNANREERQ